jgi:hypothetical protein
MHVAFAAMYTCINPHTGVPVFPSPANASWVRSALHAEPCRDIGMAQLAGRLDVGGAFWSFAYFFVGTDVA